MKYFTNSFLFFFMFTQTLLCQTDKEIEEMAKAYGYYNGIEISLDCISKGHKTLIPMVLSNKLKFENAHGEALDSIFSILLKKFGEGFNEVLDKSEKLLNCENVNYESAKDYCKDFENKYIKGMDVVNGEFIKLLLRYNPKYRNNSLREFSDNYRTKINTENHPKSKGLNCTIEFPFSWEIKEANHPNIICKAINMRNNKMIFLLNVKELMSKSELDKILQKENLKYKSEEFNAKLNDFAFNNESIEEIKQGYNKCSDVIKTKIDGQPAIIFYGEIESESSGIKIKVNQYNSYIVYKNYMIAVTLGMTEREKDISSNIITNYEFDLRLLFQAILNSLIITDKWK